MREVKPEEFVAMKALCIFLYQTSGVEFAELVFPDATPDYKAEKAIEYAQSYMRAMGHLDRANTELVMRTALEKYYDGALEEYHLVKRLLAEDAAS